MHLNIQFVFFQLIPDFFVLLQIVSDSHRFDDDEHEKSESEEEIIWFPMRRKWSNQSNILERTILVGLYNMYSLVMFIVIGSLLILSKTVALISVQNLLFQQNCFKIIQTPKYKNKEYDPDETIIDLRMHLIFLLFEVFFESLPLATIILLNSYILLNHMTSIAWISLAISGYVFLRNIFMFLDDICLSNKLQRKLYYCL